jgi:S1-C subfamily serine protease
MTQGGAYITEVSEHSEGHQQIHFKVAVPENCARMDLDLGEFIEAIPRPDPSILSIRTLTYKSKAFTRTKLARANCLLAATAKIETIFVSPEITEIRDYWEVPTSTGSGFFISHDGLILTAKHVVEDAQAIFVQDFDGRRYRAEVVQQGYYDVALLKVDGKAPSIIPILPEAELRTGQKLLTMGFPMNVADPDMYWDRSDRGDAMTCWKNFRCSFNWFLSRRNRLKHCH